MKPNKLAKLYSNILFECAKDMSVLNEVRDSISKIDNLVRSNADLKSFVQSKRLLKEDKLKVLEKVLGSSIHGLVLGVISYMSGMQTNKTIGLIKKYYHERYKDFSNQVSVQAIVSNHLNEKETKELKDNLNKALGKDADLSIKVDASIIGGIKLRVDNTFLDAS
jgi:ATP synthase, F1 delta subunit